MQVALLSFACFFMLGRSNERNLMGPFGNASAQRAVRILKNVFGSISTETAKVFFSSYRSTANQTLPIC